MLCISRARIIGLGGQLSVLARWFTMQHSAWVKGLGERCIPPRRLSLLAVLVSVLASLLWLKLLRITQRAFLPQPSTLITLPQMTATEAARYRSTLLAIAQAGMALRVAKHDHHPQTRRRRGGSRR